MRIFICKINYLLLLVLATLSMSSFAVAGCPDYQTPSCTKKIKSHIEMSKYARASESAEMQCYSLQSNNDPKLLNEKSLTLRALGCYYSYLIEKFLSNPVRSQASLEKANQLIKFGCLYNMSWLCQLTGDLLSIEKASLKNELNYDMESISEVIDRNSVHLKVHSEKILPSSISKFFEEVLTTGLKKQEIKTIDCSDCTKYSIEEKSVTAIIEYINERLVLTLKIYDPEKQEHIYEKKYGHPGVEELKDLYASLSVGNTSRPKTSNLLSIQDPGFMNSFTFGFGKIGNQNYAREQDENRMIFTLSSTEAFNYGRDEYGLAISFHKTQRSFYGTESPTSSSATDLTVYQGATVFSFKYKHNFLIANKYRNKPYFSTSLTAGMFLASDVSAPAATLTISCMLSTYSFNYTYHYIGESKKEFSTNYETGEEKSGSEISFGISL